MKNYFTIIYTAISLLIFANTAFATQKILVFVSIVPQKFFVQQIGKDMVDVKVMVQPGASPATYEPKPRQMVDLSSAQLYFSIGVSFETKWLKKITASNPDVKMIPTDQNISKIRMYAGHDHEDKMHKKSHDIHVDPESLDPHIWLSPKLVMIQAKIILNALNQTDPLNKTAYTANYDTFIARVNQLDAKLSKLFENKIKTGFLVFHPSWGYFARDYGLTQIPIEIEGKNPKPAKLKEIIDYSRANKITMIFVQPQNSSRSAKIIAQEINGHVVFADPLAFNWFGNMETVAQKLKENLQ